jgi:uncharacterized membrane protein
LGSGYARRISSDGSVVCGTAGSAVFRWTSQSGRTELGSGNIFGMSRDGSVLTLDSRMWSVSGGFQTLPPLSGGSGMGWAVDGDGSTIVGNTFGAHAVRWDGLVPTDLGIIPGGFQDADATAVTADGTQIFGIARGPQGYDAFRWTQATGMVGLGFPSAGFNNLPLPQACTADGTILVGNTFGAAIVWRLGSGPEYIQDVLEQQFGINLNGLFLEHAMGISDDGRTIVGFGSRNNARHGFMVQLPSPIPAPSTALIAIAGLLLAARHRTRPA